ncbi:MAG TPA: hypothetical protein VGR47_04440 [Terracidiphilus sp.]|nr:hypothetical protein [Terracidiphilus sp.]
MKRFFFGLFLSLLLASAMPAQAGKNNAKSGSGPPQKSKNFIDWVLDFLSISYTPGTQKGPASGVANGQIWVADLRNGSTHPRSLSGSFRSPVFLAGSGDILALRGNDVVRISSADGNARKLYSVDGILKLVGAGSHDPGKVLVLLRNETGSHPRLGLLAVDAGSIIDLPYDENSSEDLEFVEELEGWSHTYGKNRVYVKRQTKEALAGTVEWTDVFVSAPGQQALNVSRCDGTNCGQPSMSADGSLLAYVKENPTDPDSR